MTSSASFQPATNTSTFSTQDQGMKVSVTTQVRVETDANEQNQPQPTLTPTLTPTPASPSASSTETPTPPLKAGYKTTEFWLTLVAQAVGILTAMGLVSPAHSSDLSNAINTVIGASLALGTALAYIFNRTWLKTKSQS
jgi:hypothetical protein